MSRCRLQGTSTARATARRQGEQPGVPAVAPPAGDLGSRGPTRTRPEATTTGPWMDELDGGVTRGPRRTPTARRLRSHTPRTGSSALRLPAAREPRNGTRRLWAHRHPGSRSRPTSCVGATGASEPVSTPATGTFSDRVQRRRTTNRIVRGRATCHQLRRAPRASSPTAADVLASEEPDRRHAAPLRQTRQRCSLAGDCRNGRAAPSAVLSVGRGNRSMVVVGPLGAYSASARR